MAKDPAFLFYSKDWIEGTAEMLPEEKGVFIDLLAHQHQSGSLPTDTKRLAMIARLSLEDFLRIWQGIQNEFEISDGRLVNAKLKSVVTDRKSSAVIKRINGTLAGLYRKHKIDDATKEKLKTLFKIEEATEIPTENLTIWLTTWLVNSLSSLGNGNGNANTVKGEEIKEGVGGKGEEALILPRMFAIWKTENPSYPALPDKDLPALFSIAKTITQKNGVEHLQGEVFNDFLLEWGKWCKYIQGSNLQDKSLDFIARFSAQEIYQKLKKPNGTTHKQTNSTDGSDKGNPGTSKARISALSNWGRKEAGNSAA